MLNKLRIASKLLLAPCLVLSLLILIASGAYYGMVRQNASLENMVEVRAARLKAAADISGEAKFAHANIYQLLAWINGSFAQSRLDALTVQIRNRHAAIASQLQALAAVAGPDERKLIDTSSAALAGYAKSVRSTIELAQVDQSLAASSMAKAETEFGGLDEQLGRLSALEKTLSQQAHATAKAEFRALGVAMAALVILSIALSQLVTMLVRRGMLADIHAMSKVVGDLAEGRLTRAAPNHGRDEIADTARALDHTVGTLSTTLRSIMAMRRPTIVSSA